MSLEDEGVISAADLPVGSDAETQESESQAVESETTSVEPEVTSDDKARLEMMERIIATNPVLRQQYEHERYGAPYPVDSPKQTQPQQTQSEKKPLFGGEEFDWTNPNHHAEIVREQMNPLMEYVVQQQQALQNLQKQQEGALYEQLGNQIESHIDKALPGFKQDPLLYNYVFSEFDKALTTYPVNLRLNESVHKEIVQKILPSIKPYYSKLGLGNGKATQGVSQSYTANSYVEGSNVVPQKAKNEFAEAYKKDDRLGMVRAISRRS